MGGAERVVGALGALGEAGEPARLAQRADALAPPGQDLVRIGLVADIPDQPVARRVEDMVQRDGQFDHAEPRAEMPARHGNGVDRLQPQLVGDLSKLCIVERPQIGGVVDRVEERRGGAGHEGV